MHSRFALLITGLTLVAVGCKPDFRPDPYVDGGRSEEDAAAAGSPAPAPMKPPVKPPTKPKPDADGGMPAYDAGPDIQPPDLDDAGMDPAPQPDTFGITSAGKLVAFERASGRLAASYAISGLAHDESILGADIRPSNGKLYALTTHARLYTIDLASGAATLDSTLSADPTDTSDPFSALRGTKFGVDWNPVPDRLRVVSDQGQNLRIQPMTGNTITDGAINPSAALSAAAYTNSFAAACRTRLFVIDGPARRLFLQDPPNNGSLTPVGMLGDAVHGEVTSFEIQTSDGKDRALIAVVDGHSTTLFDVELASGTATRPRALQLGADETLLALSALPPTAAPVQAPGELLGVTESARLVSFNRAAPGKLCTALAIQGISAGERVLGIDVRPADGQLYALGSAAKLYTLDVASGQASLKAVLTPDALDTTDPFSVLSGSEFAVAFNPVPDRLRVFSDNGQNLRINATTGAVTTDAALSGAGQAATAAAYTNAFAGAKSTTLFALDTYADALVRVGGDPASGGACGPDVVDTNNPNCGVVSAVGPLGLGDVEDLNGFDIDGRNGSALAALSLVGATSSTLYSIDLTTGAATLPAGTANGTIGGGERLRGLTLAANPVVSALALTADGKLLAFSPSTPSAPSAVLPISGLAAGEMLLGLDVRPADGKLYGLGSANLYTVDRASGSATLLAPLAAASGDDNPFVTLEPCDHGVDFNPVADLLRVVNAAGANLRVAPSARAMLRLGDVVTDTWLNPGTPNAVAAAYTNNFAGSTATTLYVLDVSNDTLQLQGGLNGTPSPNTGTLTQVGQLNVDAIGNAGFDIVGGHNGLALAALQRSDARSALYTVQLSGGAATPFTPDNLIGAEGTAPIIGLSLDLK